MTILIGVILLVVLCVLLLQVVKPEAIGVRELVRALLWAAVFVLVLSLARWPNSVWR